MAITLNGTTGITTPGLSADSPTLFVDSANDRVGIGTTNASAKFEVFSPNAAMVLSGDSGASRILMGNRDSGGLDNPAAIVSANGNLYFGGANSWDPYTTTFDYAMQIVNSGNVGIGVPAGTDPTSKLDVVGSIRAVTSTTSATTVRIGNTGNNVFLGVESSTGGTNIIGSTAYAGTLSSNGPLQFSINNGASIQATINSSGNVGIGTTNPTEKLQVQGRVVGTSGLRAGTTAAVASSGETLSVLGQATIRLDSSTSATTYFINADTTASTIQPYLFCSDTAGNRSGIGIEYSTAITSFYGQGGISLQTGTSGFGYANERLRITSSGLIGIGGNGTGTGLGVFLRRSSPAIYHFYEASDGTKTMITGIDSTIDYVKIGSLSNHRVGLIANNGEKISILPSGNIGIGTTNPGSKLDVRGEITSITSLDDKAAVIKSGTSVAINNNSTKSLSSLGNNGGFLIINTNQMAIFLITRGVGDSVTEISDPSNFFSVTQGTTNSNNLYFTGGILTIQNLSGVNRSYRYHYFTF